jgi:phycocyanin beta chain
MLDAFAKVVSQADARGEYLSSSQLDALSAMVAEGNKRMDTVNDRCECCSFFVR